MGGHPFVGDKQVFDNVCCVVCFPCIVGFRDALVGRCRERSTAWAGGGCPATTPGPSAGSPPKKPAASACPALTKLRPCRLLPTKRAPFPSPHVPLLGPSGTHCPPRSAGGRSYEQ